MSYLLRCFQQFTTYFFLQNLVDIFSVGVWRPESGFHCGMFCCEFLYFWHYKDYKDKMAAIRRLGWAVTTRLLARRGQFLLGFIHFIRQFKGHILIFRLSFTDEICFKWARWIVPLQPLKTIKASESCECTFPMFWCCLIKLPFHLYSTARGSALSPLPRTCKIPR